MFKHSATYGSPQPYKLLLFYLFLLNIVKKILRVLGKTDMAFDIAVLYFVRVLTCCELFSVINLAFLWPMQVENAWILSFFFSSTTVSI